MKTSDIILVLTAFLASRVEAVEALTVVLATGVTRGWRSTSRILMGDRRCMPRRFTKNATGAMGALYDMLVCDL